MPAERSELERYVESKLRGDVEPEVDHVIDNSDPHYLRALERERRAELEAEGDGEAEAAPAFDPAALEGFASSSAAQMGFDPGGEPQTAMETFFEDLPEPTRDALWTTWYASLDPEDQPGALAGDDEAIASFARFVEQGGLPTALAAADGIPGARVVREPLHAPLRRFRQR